MKLSKEHQFGGNPRKITDRQFSLLKAHLAELGDLGGVIFCRHNNAYVGGNMRSEIMDGAEIELIEAYEEPTKNKTLAHGFIKWQGEKFAYREVYFTEEEFRKACIVANNDGGSFDFEILANEWDQELLEDWGMILDWQDMDRDSIDMEGSGVDKGLKNIFVECKDVIEASDLFAKLEREGFKVTMK